MRQVLSDPVMRGSVKACGRGRTVIAPRCGVSRPRVRRDYRTAGEREEPANCRSDRSFTLHRSGSIFPRGAGERSRSVGIRGRKGMSKTIYGFVFRYSARQQVLLLLVTLAAFPFLYLSLELPKTIINRAINGQDFPAELLGMEFDQIPYLVLLCGIFLLLVLINGAFKFTINVWKGRLGERMLRRLRYELYSRVLRFPLPHFKRVSQGEIIPMITSEVEPLGGFIGDAVAQPVFQGGQLLTIFAFILVQDPFLGLAAISLYPLQGYLIPKLQRRVNDLAKQRVRTVRRLSDRLGESISGIAEIRAHDASNFHRAGFADLLGRIYEIRFEIYQRKFFIKFLNNFLAQLTPFFFYL